jgi:hypothetical protein
VYHHEDFEMIVYDQAEYPGYIAVSFDGETATVEQIQAFLKVMNAGGESSIGNAVELLVERELQPPGE